MAEGLAMYDLKEVQIHAEQATDTHVLVAWSADTILIAFRGTVTKANVLADLQVSASQGQKLRSPSLVTQPIAACTMPAVA